MSNDLADMLVGMQEDGVLAAARAAKEAGTPPVAVVADLQEGMRIIGEKFEEGEYFLSELIMAAEIFKSALSTLGIDEAVAGADSKGTVVLGTVQSDIHDIGKNIVASVLRANGFTVVDLGVDVAPQAYIDAVKERGARVVGLSCLLTTAFPSMQKTLQALDAAGLRQTVGVMIGGGPVTKGVAAKIGADGAGISAQEAVRLAEEIVGGSS